MFSFFKKIATLESSALFVERRQEKMQLVKHNFESKVTVVDNKKTDRKEPRGVKKAVWF